MSRNFITTPEDQQYRQEVVEQILRDSSVAANQQAACQDFAAWAKAHKRLLIGLFGGQGLQNLHRIVAWQRREQLAKRRTPMETLCGFTDLFQAGQFARREPILHERWTEPRAMLRDAMLDPLVAQVLMHPWSGALPSDGRAALVMALHLL